MSTLQVANISDGTDTVGTEYVTSSTAKAWANYDQSVPSISDSLNVTSVTDDGLGQSIVNYASIMFAVNDGGAFGSSAQDETQVFDFLAASHYAITRSSSGSKSDVVSMTLRWGDFA